MPLERIKPVPERRFAVAMVFSFLLIAESLAAVMLIAVAAAPDPNQGLAVAVGSFALIALVPIWILRKANESPWAHRTGFRTVLANLFSRSKRERERRRRIWKRKRTTEFTPEPFGQESVSTFVPGRHRQEASGNGQG